MMATVGVALLLPALRAQAQMDQTHYVPPFFAQADVGEQFIVVSTAQTAPFDVTVRDGAGTLVTTITGVSRTTPQTFDLSGRGYDQLGILQSSELNQVTTEGLILTASYPFSTDVRHRAQDQGMSLTPKGRFGLGTEFRSGHLITNERQRNQKAHFLSVMATEDGTTVTFSEVDPNLADLVERTLQRVSVADDGRQANGPSQAQGFLPSVDAGCTCVAFSSDATNLVAGDSNGKSDIFVRDVIARTTIRASVGISGQANGSSSFPSVSADCSRIAFQSVASNLVDADTNRAADIFVYNRTDSSLARISVATGGLEANGPSSSPAMSADGRCVAFVSAATNMWPGETNEHRAIYVACDGEGTCRASVDSFGNQANGDSYFPSLSSDGRYVAFKSLASNLVPCDSNAAADAFVHDCVTGSTEMVSVNTCGQQGDDAVFPPDIDADGRFVAFGSFATNLVPGQRTRAAQVYVRDRLHGTTSLVSSTGTCAAGNSSTPDAPVSLSDDGTIVGFASLASDLVVGDTNEASDAFLREYVFAPALPCLQDRDCATGQACVEDECQLP